MEIQLKILCLVFLPSIIAGDCMYECLKDVAYCNPILNKCQCLDGIGCGDLDCYRDNWIYGFLKNDPMLRTYKGEHVNHPVPCRFLATHLKTELKWKENGQRVVKGECEIVVHAWNEKHAGKIYVGGYDIAIKINYFDGNTDEIKATVRKSGDADNGVYTYNEWSNDSIFDVTGNPVNLFNTPISVNEGNVVIDCQKDLDNERAVLDVRACGVRGVFRPYDKTLRIQQEYVPGFTFGVNCVHHPKFFSKDKAMFLHPKTSIDDVNFAKPVVSAADYMIYRSFTQLTEQNLIDSNSYCNIIGENLLDCSVPQLGDVFSHCKWLLTEPRFIKRCDGSNNAELVSMLFSDCVRAFCDATYSVDAFRGMLAAFYPANCKNTVDNIDKLNDWLTGMISPSS